MIPDTKHGEMTSNIRFVVGSSGSIEEATQAKMILLDDPVLQPHSIGIVTKLNVLLRGPGLLSAVGEEIVPRAEFDFLAAHDDKIVCIGGTLGRLLREREIEGSRTLNDALRRWLLPRHAESLSDVVERNGILIWVEIHSLEEERAASISLLRHSQGRVEVHDFAPASLAEGV
jgi:hypothetical protein